MKIKKSFRLFTVLSVLSPIALSMMSPKALAQAVTDEVKEGKERTTVIKEEGYATVTVPFKLAEETVISNEEEKVETETETVVDGDTEEVDSETETETETVVDIETGDSEELTTDDETERDVANDEVITLADRIESLRGKKDALATERDNLIADAIENKKTAEELGSVVEEFNSRVLADLEEALSLKEVEEGAQEFSEETLFEIEKLTADIEVLAIDLEVDIVSQIDYETEEIDEVEETEEEVVAEEETEEEAEETEEVEEETLVDNSAEEENEQLHQVVCEQKDQIANLTSQIEALKADATPYTSMMDMMAQLMMMNQMMMMQSMQQPQQPYGYGGNAVDFTSQLVAPMMMMQSMSMGMQVANMSAYSNPFMMAGQMSAFSALQPQNQNVYNVGGDYYGRDYSMTSPMQQATGASSLMPGSFPYRDFNFGNIVSGDRVTTNVPGTTQASTGTTVIDANSAADAARDPSADENQASTTTSTDGMIQDNG